MDSPHTNKNCMTLSINNMVKQASGLIDTVHLSEWENQFLITIAEKTADGSNVSSLTDKQIVRLSQIYNTHFSG